MSDDMASMVIDDTRDRMAKAVERARGEFASIRTGRAAPALVEKIPVEYYGSEVPLQPDYAKNEFRSIKPEIAVLVGVCSHLGCSPQFKGLNAPEMGAGWDGGFYCPCHGSKFDFAGRVYKGVPAPVNLTVPPYEFVSDNKIVIGEDKKKA